MLLEVTQALSSLKSISDITTLILKTTIDSNVTQKAIELQSSIISLQTAMLSIQTQNQELLAENDCLKKELVSIKNWESEAANYNLQEIYPGTFVYAINQDQLATQPYHWLCAHCYHNKQKSLLQRGNKEMRGWLYHCANCKTHILGPSEPTRLISPPETAT